MEINVQEFFNQNRISKFQFLIFILTALVALFDGFDTVAISYVAPSLLNEWHIEASHLAPVLSAALFGLAIGAVSFGPVADKIGRKKVMIISVIIFSLLSIASAFVNNIDELVILRFITGVGLGAAIPNAVTLLSEYCPDRRRALMVNMMFCGFPIGSALGGFLASWLIPTFGWRSVFWIGGILPLITSFFMILLLPESVRFMVHTKKPISKIKHYLSKIHPSAQQADAFTLAEKNVAMQSAKNPMAIVLSKHYFLGSFMLWASYFLGLMVVYGIINWMPTLFKEAQMPDHLGPIVTGLFQLGGLGAIISGILMDRFNATILVAICSLLSAIFVAFIGQSLDYGLATFIIVITIGGAMQNTAQSSLPVLAAAFYPTAARATGVAWMNGIGRFGAIAGTFLTSILVREKVSLTHIFYILAIPALIMLVCLLIKYFAYPETREQTTPITESINDALTEYKE